MPVQVIPGIERRYEQPKDPVIGGFRTMGVGFYIESERVNACVAHFVLDGAREGADVSPEQITDALRQTGDIAEAP